MKAFILYGTLGCHLCETAEALLTPLLDDGYSIECIDISASDALLERYGTSIPVLRRLRDDVELHWPFDSRQVQLLLVGD
ncbi:MAG TPA: glutaredoxin family protein [Spongiibacteraceae bacterium]|jgi:hypothetical protein